MSEDRLDLNWRSPGPVSSRYMRELKKVNVLNGPIGAGKTRTNFSKAIRLAALQKQSTQDGLRKFKLCTVHANYRQLWRSTLPSWFKLLPKTAGEWNGAENGPAKHVTTFQLPDGTKVLFQIDFIAIGENAAEDVMRGYEPTAFFLNELDLLSEEVYTFARGRTGRYPDMAEGGPSWHGILADCNAPERTSWLYEKMFRTAPDNVLLLRQPGAIDQNGKLSPQAENVPNLPPGYYDDQIKDQPEWYIARMVRNIPGFSRLGKPVYPEFTDALHYADRELEPIIGLPLGIGMDAGGSPAAALGQKAPNGQWRILDELVSEAGTGPIRFGRDVARLLRDRYPGWRTIHCWADPSAAYGADKQMGESSWIEIVEQEAGVRVVPAPTNQQIPRLEAVRRPLTTLIDGQPGMLVSSRCPIIHEAFNSGYCYLLMQVPGPKRYAEKPDKGPFSHVMNALEYLCSAEGEDLEIRGRKGEWSDHARAAQAGHVNDWDPFALHNS
jgi:hypothetical protein